MEAGQIKGHQFSIVASRINISRTVPSSLYVTQRIPSMIAKNQVFSTNFFEKRAENCLFADKIEFFGKWLHSRAKLKKTDPT